MISSPLPTSRCAIAEDPEERRLTIALANADRSAAISLSLENLFVFRPGSARAFGGVCCVSSKSKCRCHKNQLLWPLWPSSNVFAAHCYPPYQCKPIAVQQGGSSFPRPSTEFFPFATVLSANPERFPFPPPIRPPPRLRRPCWRQRRRGIGRIGGGSV